MNLHSSQKRAFSLIEVVLSLGVVSFTLIGIFGLLFTGLTTFHESVDYTVQSQIAQKIIGEAQLSPYGSLVDYSTNFDQYGSGVSASDPAVIYTVKVTLANLPDSMTTNIASTAATNLVLHVWNRTSPNGTNVYSSVLVNNN